MNVYDFDGTIYHGDSTRDFVFYLIKHYPKVIKYMPAFLLAAIKYKIGLISKTKMKETLYRFLNDFKNTEIKGIVSSFWDSHKKNIYNWYYDIKNDSDVIISASPKFLLSHICDELNVNLICSEVNIKNGDYIGFNCFGEEKVNRFFRQYPNGIIDKFYSDSKSDEPLAKLSKEAYRVSRIGEIIEW